MHAQRPFFIGLGTLPDLPIIAQMECLPTEVLSSAGASTAGTTPRYSFGSKQTGAVDLNLPVEAGEVLLSRSGTSVFAHLLAGYSGNDGPWRWTAETGWVPLPKMFLRPDFSGRGLSTDGSAAA